MFRLWKEDRKFLQSMLKSFSSEKLEKTFARNIWETVLHLKYLFSPFLSLLHSFILLQLVVQAVLANSPTLMTKWTIEVKSGELKKGLAILLRLPAQNEELNHFYFTTLPCPAGTPIQTSDKLTRRLKCFLFPALKISSDIRSLSFLCLKKF